MSGCGEPGEFIIGMDIGSTTIKAVVVRRGDDQVLWRDYRRHDTKLGERALEFLSRIEAGTGACRDNARIFLTGSGGRDLADLVGGRFAQEVNAVAFLVDRMYPDVQSVIELGGQDSKIIVFKERPGGNGRKKIAMMNDRCAGGTGAVLDKIGAKLGIPAERLGEHRYRGRRIHRVAAKCGVFAETDVNSLQKQGIPVEELIASLFEAIVVQNLTVLTRGHTLFPRVLLLGGPNRFIKGLQEAWQEHLPRLWRERGVSVPEDLKVEELVVAPEDGHFFGALGAAEFGKAQEESVGRYAGLDVLRDHLMDRQLGAPVSSPFSGLHPLTAGLDRFLREYEPKRSASRPPSRGRTGRVFLGVDGGSTSTKAVLIGEDGAVVSAAYRLSRGNPIQDTIDLVGELRAGVEGQGAHVEVAGVATTGYAKDVLKRILRADTAVVETVAHAQSAIHLYGNPDVIVDVGGQDIKLVVLKDGHVKDFMLNTQCSAGNGYFLQATAETLGLDVSQYAETAFRARRIPEFSYGCAVFLQSDLVDYQRQGWKPEELLAGLAAVLPKNIWLYVAKISNLSNLGRTFILQGGTQRNLAAVKAQVDYIRHQFRGYGKEVEIIVHEHCGEAGAIGAALEARRLWAEGKATEFPGLEAVEGITYRTISGPETVCGFCKNRCLRTFVDFKTPGNGKASANPVGSVVASRPGEDRYIVAGCEKGMVEDKGALRAVVAGLNRIKRASPDLVAEAAVGVWRSFDPVGVADSLRDRSWRTRTRRRRRQMLGRGQIRIGLPRVLGMYQNGPFFSAYLESLGVDPANLVYSDFTTDEMYREGTRRGAIDPCFPAKVVMAHIHNLLQKHLGGRPLDAIFLPMLDAHVSPMVNTAAANACSTVIAAPQTARAMFIKEKDVFSEHGVEYLYPILDMSHPKLLARQLHVAWGMILGLSPEENGMAVAQGFDALARWDNHIRGRGRAVIDMLERENRLGIVMLGRSYHHDPGLNHGVFQEFQKLGYPVLSQDTLPMDAPTLDRLFGDEVRAGIIDDPLDVSDVWKHSYIASTAMKLWAAKFVARHPNLLAVEISNFKCGHDAPINQVVEKIIESAGLPFFSFRDVDENKPSGSFKVRIETIHYFLQRHREDLIGRRNPLTVAQARC
ncbi:BadF/BadG/BcrA/BcrD ATPase family protein [Gemmatimonadota bacterium]